MTQSEVKITPPDKSLHRKIGNIPLDAVFTSKTVEQAQKVIQESDGQFMTEGMAQIEEMVQANAALQKEPTAMDLYLPTLISTSFSIKSKVMAGGYSLISALAKSLHVLCEQMLKNGALTSKDLEIINWHVTSMRVLLQGDLKGDGGKTGAAIIAQLQLLAPSGVL